MNINRNRIGVCPVDYSGCSIVSIDDVDKFRSKAKKSLTFEYIVKVDGKTLGDIEQMVSNNSFNLQDPEHRSKSEQIDQQIAGKIGEVAFQYIADEDGLNVEWLADDRNGYAFDHLLVGDNNKYGIELKTAQMSSRKQNIPIRAKEYELQPKHSFEQDGIMTDVLVFAYIDYDGSSYYVGFEGTEPVKKDANGILSREHKTLYNGDLFVYDSKYIRHKLSDIDKDVMLNKLD